MVDMIRPSNTALGGLPLGGDPLGQIAENRFMPPALTQVAAAATPQPAPDIVGGEGDDVLIGAGSPPPPTYTAPASTVPPGVTDAITKFITTPAKATTSPTSDAYNKAVTEYMKPDEPTGSFASLIGRDPGAAFYYALLRGGLGAMQAAGTPGATGFSSLGAGMGAGVDATVKMQAAYDAAQRKRKTEKLAAIQAAAALEQTRQKTEFDQQATKAKLGLQFQTNDRGERQLQLAGDTLAEKQRAASVAEATASERTQLMRDKFAQAKTKAARDNVEAYILINKDDPTQEPNIQYVDPVSKRGAQLRKQGYLPIGVAESMFDRETKNIEVALNRTRTELRIQDQFWKESQARQDKKPFYRQTDEGGIETLYFNPKIPQELDAIRVGGWQDAKALDLQDKLKPDTQYEILARQGEDGKIETTVVNVKDENSFSAAVADGYDRKLGVLDTNEDVVQVFDTQTSTLKSFIKGTDPHSQYLRDTEATPERYQLVAKIRPEKPITPSATTVNKLQGQYDNMFLIQGRVENAAQMVVDDPSIVGAAGQLQRFTQSFTGATKDIARLVFRDIERVQSAEVREAGEELYAELTSVDIIQKELKNSPNYNPALVKIRQLENEVAYALARIEKPSEKINKSDVDAFRTTYTIQAMNKSGYDAKQAIVSMADRLKPAMALLKRRLGKNFLDPNANPRGLPVLDLESGTIE